MVSLWMVLSVRVDKAGIDSVVLASTNFARYWSGGLVVANMGSQTSVLFMLTIS